MAWLACRRGAGAGAIVVAYLIDEPDIGVRQLRGAFRDQLLQLLLVPLQLLLVLAELRVGPLALLLELLLDDRFIAEDADRIGHVGEFVATARRHLHVQPSRRKAAHGPVQRRQPVDDIAVHVEPGDGDRYGDEEHDLEQQGEPAELDGAVRRLGRIRGDQLRARDDGGDVLVHPLGQREVVVGKGRERRIEGERLATHIEEAQGAGRPVGRERGHQRPGLRAAAGRVVDQGHPAREDALVAAVALLDPPDLVRILGAPELVQQQTLLGRAHPELEHPLQQEQVGLDQPVEGIQRGRQARGVFDELVEVGDDDGRTRCRVGSERLRQARELAGRIQRARDRFGQGGIHPDTRRDDPVLPVEIGGQGRDHPPELDDLLLREAVPLQRIEAGGEQIGGGTENAGLDPPLALGLGRGKERAVRGDLRRGLGDDAPLGDRRHGLIDDRGLGGVDVAQDDPADDPGGDGESRHDCERGEQAACDPETAEHPEIKTPVGIERQSAAE